MLFWVFGPGSPWTWTKVDKSGQKWTNWTKFDTQCLATTAPGVEENCKATALSESKPKIDTSGAKFNRVWRRKGRFWNRKGPKSTQQKIHERFPLFLGLKIEQCGRQSANKKLTSVSPFQRMEMRHSDRQATRKNTPPQMCIVLPFQGKNYGGIWACP